MTAASLTFIPDAITVGAANTLTGDFTTLLSAYETGTITSNFGYSPYVAGTGVITLTNIDGTIVTYTLNTLSEQIPWQLHALHGHRHHLHQRGRLRRHRWHPAVLDPGQRNGDVLGDNRSELPDS